MSAFRVANLLFMASLLAGCISFPQTPDQFRTSAAGALEFTASESLRDSYALVAERTINCHQGGQSSTAMVGGAFFVFPTGSTRIEGRIDQDEGNATLTIHYFNPAASGLLQVIDFAQVTATETRIVVYRLNDTKKWRTSAESVEEWFQGGTDCYKLW